MRVIVDTNILISAAINGNKPKAVIDYIKLRGIIRCDQLLISELKQQPCVYYRMIIERE